MLVKFERVRSELNPFSWRWYSLFLVDVAVYTGNKDYSKIVAKHMEDYPKGTWGRKREREKGGSEIMGKA